MNIKRSVKIKICGITSVEDAVAISQLGVDAMGCIMVKESSRYVTQEKVAEIFSSLPPFIARVLVLVNEPIQSAMETAKYVKATCVQLHGEETVEYCQQWNIPVIKAFRVSNREDLKKIEPYRSIINGILVDAYDESVRGGTGKTIAWDIFSDFKIKERLILSGGLKLDNIQEALQKVQPYAVDINSGVELSPGVKDIKKVQQILKMIRP